MQPHPSGCLMLCAYNLEPAGRWNARAQAGMHPKSVRIVMCAMIRINTTTYFATALAYLNDRQLACNLLQRLTQLY